MKQDLTQQEKKYIENLLQKPQQYDNKAALFLAQALLLLGGGVLVYTIFYSIQNMTDRMFYYFMLPGIGMGLIVIFLALFLKRIYTRSLDTRMIVTILKKLLEQ